MNTPEVSVVTLTRDREHQLRRALRSVAGQEGVETEHIVVGDASSVLADHSLRSELEASAPRVRLRNIRHLPRRCTTGEYVTARVALLRNVGVSLARADLIAYLDDDNEFEPWHLRSLVDTLDRHPGAEVAHSWRHLVDEEGRVFEITDCDPWTPDPEAARIRFVQLRDLGVLSSGSAIVRDALVKDGRTICRVDTNEFLIRRAVHERVPWPMTYSRARMKLEMTEDVAFSHALLKHGVQIVCSERASVRYYMGGRSTRADPSRSAACASRQ
jgi:glycosyltransferase involved in cell wall biosynthesis